MPIVQYTTDAASFFATQYQNNASDDLISEQIDPSEPQVDGLSSYTDPLVVDQIIAARLSNFDPTLYDLSATSHLVRFLSALLGAAGVGGLRRQQTINRLSASMSGTFYLDLDGFWGAIFNTSRMSDEALPTINGTALDPATSVADRSTWDAADSRDGKLRSRIIQTADGFAEGGTYYGVRMVAEAVLGCEVDLSESWVIVDTLPVGYHASTLNANTYYELMSKYTTYGNMRTKKWGELQGGVTVSNNVPLGNRSEVVLTPKRAISDEERLQVAQVVEKLIPAWCILTVVSTPVIANAEVIPRFVYADSTDWSVSSSVSAYQGVADFADSIYPTMPGALEASRPALSDYSGERWVYNSRVSTVRSYPMVGGKPTSTSQDYQTILFKDGYAQEYSPDYALLDPKQAALTRNGTEGILTNYPYAPERFG